MTLPLGLIYAYSVVLTYFRGAPKSLWTCLSTKSKFSSNFFPGSTHLLHQSRLSAVLVQHRRRQHRQRRGLLHRRRLEHRRQRVRRKTSEFAAADAAMFGGEFADVVVDVVEQRRRRFVHQVGAGQNIQLS